METNVKHKEKLLPQGYKTFQLCRNVNLSFFTMVAPKKEKEEWELKKCYGMLTVSTVCIESLRAHKANAATEGDTYMKGGRRSEVLVPVCCCYCRLCVQHTHKHTCPVINHSWRFEVSRSMAIFHFPPRPGTTPDDVGNRNRNRPAAVWLLFILLLWIVLIVTLFRFSFVTSLPYKP